jgi:hypothetical protein
MFLLFVVLWSSMAAFGLWGIAVTVIVVMVSNYICRKKESPIFEALLILGSIFILYALLQPAVMSSLGPEGAKDICISRLRKHAAALRTYHTTHGCFPPACITDKAGKPIHSWRAVLLPLVDTSDVKEFEPAYDYHEPWNGPNNSKVSWGTSRYRHHVGHVYCCPRDDSWWGYKGQGPDMASYFSVVGPQTAWRGATPVKLDDLPERGRRMILLVEASRCNINWKEPKDLTFDEAAAGVRRQEPPYISGCHSIGGDYWHRQRNGAYVAMVDGSVRFLPDDISSGDLRALLTGDVSRPIDLDALERPSLDWSHIVALAVFIASSLAMLVGSVVQAYRRVHGHTGR